MYKRQGQVTVNGQPLAEDYVSCLAVGNMDIADETLVPAGEVFVLGDERLTALDLSLIHIFWKKRIIYARSVAESA